VLAAGLADTALGTDSGGSIRIPAACCGIVGFKPTYGLVSLEGCFPLAPSWDHVGPMARTVGECVSMMEALAPGFEPTEIDPDDVTVGVAWLDECDPLVRSRIEEAAARFPNRREIDFPVPHRIFPGFMAEVADVHRELFLENRDLYGADVAGKVEDCLAVSDQTRAEAAATRERYREQALEALGELDFLIVPTLAFVAPKIGATWNEPVRSRMTRYTRAFNDTGWPALALPCGPAEDGLPASVQIVGRPEADALVLAAGRTLESLLRVTPERG
jgi:Asp-tRNA(Asn)/Glu-tRNA(Gln) amidotransferase A subunit family amidase